MKTVKLSVGYSGGTRSHRVGYSGGTRSHRVGYSGGTRSYRVDTVGVHGHTEWAINITLL